MQPAGHCPTVAEGLARHGQLRQNGSSDPAFGRAWVLEAGLGAKAEGGCDVLRRA